MSARAAHESKELRPWPGAAAVGRVAPFAVAALLGCAQIAGFEEFEAATSPVSTAAACGEAPAPGRGPEMVEAHRADGSCFWIDRTEVTRKQYDAFLEAGPLGGGALACEKNDSFDPGPCEAESDGPSSAGPESPVTCVDWCDAAAFCVWAGKALCSGKYAELEDATTSAWFAACSSAGADTYPYGAYDADACNGSERSETGCEEGTCALVETGTLLTCEGKGGLFDMSGNAAEWVNECNATGESAKCRVRGGSVNDTSEALRCGSAASWPRLSAHPTIGFRCCDEE